jgi:hypothetical protein
VEKWPSTDRFLHVNVPLRVLSAQDLAPRAYLITPTHSNAIILAYSQFSGSLQFAGAVSIAGATANANLLIFSYYHTLNFFGRTASVTIAIPYGIGNFRGTSLDAPKYSYRSGLLDSFVRFSMNLRGGPARKSSEFAEWRQKILLGASLKIVAPTGQYDPTWLINWANNRWGFKPEFGYSQRSGHWVLDGYAGAWFFTTNPEFFSRNRYFPNSQIQTQQPIGTFEGHLSYDFKPRLWVSLDANFWFGGKTSLNGVQNPVTLQRSSRVGATGSVPLTKYQSIKISYSNGAYVSYGGNYQNASLAWQYSRVGWPKFH